MAHSGNLFLFPCFNKVLDYNKLSDKCWIAKKKNMDWFPYLYTEIFNLLKNQISKKIQKHPYLLILLSVSDPNFENHAIGSTEFFFWPYNLRYTCQSTSDFIILTATTKISKNNLTMCMFRPTIVFVEIGKHQNTMITECTITAKGVRRLKHKKEEFEDTKGVIRIHIPSFKLDIAWNLEKFNQDQLTTLTKFFFNIIFLIKIIDLNF